MSGQFILLRLTDQDLEDIQNAWLSDDLTVPVLSDAAHAAGTDNGVGGTFPGWNEGSRAVLNNGLQGTQLGNRSGLPPHRYLGFGVGSIKGNGKRGKYLVRNAPANGWVTQLLRPGGMGLAELAGAARGDWPDQKAKAFGRQIVANGASVEIYHIGADGMDEI
jgi:hypothetical protein